MVFTMGCPVLNFEGTLSRQGGGGGHRKSVPGLAKLDMVTRWLFFKDLNRIISTGYVCADGLQGLSAFHCPIQLLTFYLLL